MKKILFTVIFVLMAFMVSLQAQSSKLKLAVYATGNVDALSKNIAQNNASTVLVQGGRYQMIERSSEFLNIVSKEQNYQRSGAVDDSQIADLGKQYGADCVCVVDITLMDKYLYVAVRMIDVVVGTSQHAGEAENVNYSSPADLRKCVTEAVNKMEGKLPESNYVSNYVSNSMERVEMMIGEDKYFGEIRNGQPHGKGKITYSANDHRKYYEGDWSEGKRHGYGTLVFNDGDKYVGNYEDGEWNGYGIYYFADGRRYEGNWLDDKKYGNGTFYWADGDKYVGNFDDKINGYGIYYYANGNRYEGNWIDGYKQGYGTFYWADGDRYVGSFENGDMSGYGIYYWADGGRYEGDWKNDERHGYGTYYWPDGRSERRYYKDGVKQ